MDWGFDYEDEEEEGRQYTFRELGLIRRNYLQAFFEMFKIYFINHRLNPELVPGLIDGRDLSDLRPYVFALIKIMGLSIVECGWNPVDNLIDVAEQYVGNYLAVFKAGSMNLFIVMNDPKKYICCLLSGDLKFYMTNSLQLAVIRFAEIAPEDAEMKLVVVKIRDFKRNLILDMDKIPENN
jgi:hypothetical protein